MKKPILVIMAAGMGSRYGGLKQIDPVDKEGHLIIDYSIYDAIKAGVEEVVCIIKPENRETFEERIGKQLEGKVKLSYAYQTPDLPKGFEIPEGRVKPWGTAHAVLCAKDYINSSFIVINADDFYGRTAFETVFNYLQGEQNPTKHSMVAYKLINTLTENGHVARGVCTVDNDDNLVTITERTHIEMRENGGAYTEDGENFTFLEANTPVSMNLWGFQHSILDAIESNFEAFLRENLPKNPLKCEYFLPFVPDLLLKAGKASVKVLHTSEKWYGVTYKEDKPKVMAAIEDMKNKGLYPRYLWR